MNIKYNLLRGILLEFGAGEIEEGTIFLETMARGFATSDNPKVVAVSKEIQSAVNIIRQKEKGGWLI